MCCLVAIAGAAFVLLGRPALDSPEASRSPVIRALSSEQPGEVAVRWRSVDGVQGYRVTASLQQSMVDPVAQDFTQAKGQLEGLTPGQRYYVKVTALGDEDGGSAGSTRTVVVLGPPPSDVEVKADDPVSATVRWGKVDDVSTYTVRHAATEDMADASVVDVDDVDRVRLKDLEPGATRWVTVQAGDDPRATSEPVKVRLAATVPVSVGTFNLFGVNNDGKLPGGAAPWRQRRGTVVDQITGANLQVVGIQEANQASSYGRRVDFGANQMTDLRGSLQREKAGWKLVNDVSYNCARSTTPNRCARRDLGASNGTRILYRSDLVDVVRSGSVRYSAQNASTDRYLAWAVMRPSGGGQEFFFATTHLQPGKSGSDVATRRSQWRQLIAEVKARAGDRPVIVTGDFNTSRNQRPAEMFGAMRTAGFGDVLDTEAGVNPPRAVRAKEVVRGNIGSYHGFRRSLRGANTCYCGSTTRTGNSIDFIFASNDLDIARYELVAQLDAGFGLTGTMPSDHHLVTSVIDLPYEK